MKTRGIFSRHSLPNSSEVQSGDWIAKPQLIVLAAVVLFILIFSINLFLGWRQLEERKRITLNDDKTTASLLTYIIMERNKATIEILQSYAHRHLFVTAVKNKDVAGVHRHMSDLKKNVEIDLTFVTDKRGFLWVNFPIFPEAIGKDLSSRDWYKGISSNWTPYISTVFKLIVGDKPLAAAFCVPIFDEKEMVVGILATSQRLGFLEDINRRLPLDHNVKVSIIDQKGKILYSNKYSYKGSITDYRLFPIAEQALKAKKQQMEISDPQDDQEKIYLTVVSVVDYGWSVIIERPLKDIFRLEIRNFIGMGFVSFLLFLLIVSFLFYLRKVFVFRKTEELLQSEIKLRQSEEWHRSILKTTMDGFMAVDMQGNLLEVNDAYSQMSGYSEQELLTMRISDLEATETLKDTTAHIQWIATEGEDRFESLHRRKDGSLFNVESSVQYRPSNGGQIVAFLRDITNRKQSELKLLEGRQRLEFALQNGKLAMWDWFPQTGAVAYSDLWAKMLEYMPDEVEPTVEFFKQQIHPDDLPVVLDRLTGHIERHAPLYESEHRLRTKSGKWLWVLDRGKTVDWDKDGSPARVIGIIIDITSRKQTEVGLHQSEEKFSKAFQTSPYAITITRPEDGTFIEINDAFTSMTGFTKEEGLAGSSIGLKMWVNEEDRQCVVADIRKGQAVVSREYQFRTKSGKVITGLFSAQMIHLSQGLCILSSINDITERKNLEEKYQTLFREMLDGFALHEIICDEQGLPADYRFLAVNPAFERMTGLKAEELIGRTVLDVLPETERYWIETYGKVALTGEPALFENYAVELGKNFEVTAFQSAPKQFACMFTDITERKRMEEEKTKLESQLFQSQKMEAIGTLAGGIAHDFNNILAVIIGYTELARDRSQKENKEQYLQETLKGAERARNLVKQILTFSRQEGNEKKPLDIKILLKEAVKFLRASIPSTIEIDQHITGEDYTIMADPTQMH